MKATIEQDVPATPENMDRFYAELLLMATQGVKDRKPMMLMVWEDEQNFRQKAVDMSDVHCAQVVIGFMQQFPYVFQTACRYIVNYTQQLSKAKEESKNAVKN